MKNFRKAHEAKIRNAALVDAEYFGRREPNYMILKEKMIRRGATVQGATNAIELLKRAEKSRKNAADATKKTAAKRQRQKKKNPQTEWCRKPSLRILVWILQRWRKIYLFKLNRGWA